MNKNSKVSSFSGLLLNFDMNTIPENESYRFDSDNLQIILNELFKVESNIFEQTVKTLK
jgi:hypothetical protein